MSFKCGLYDVDSLELVFDLSPFIYDYDLTFGLNGNVSGELFCEFWNEAGEFLPLSIKSFYSNSHYVRVGDVKLYPSVISGVSSSSSNANVFTISLKSYSEYIEDIEVIPFYRGLSDSLTLNEGDISNTFNVYANSNLGILRNVLFNNEQVMIQRNAPSSLIDYSLLDGFLSSLGSSGSFTKSYRVNGFELQSLGVITSDLLGDTSQLVRVTTSQNLAAPFSFIYEVVESSSVFNVSLGSESQFFNVSYDNLNRVSYRDVTLTGNDLLERQRLERRSTGEKAAYSSYLAEKGAEKTDNVSQQVNSLLLSVMSVKGNVSLSTKTEKMDVLDFVNITEFTDVLPSIGSGSTSDTLISGIVVEYNATGSEVSYTLQIGENINSIVQIHSGDNALQRAIFTPLKNAKALSLRTSKASHVDVATGWKQ